MLFLLIITALAVLFVTKAWSGPDIQGRKRLLVAGLLLATAAGAFFSWLDPGDIWKRWEAMANTPVLALEDRDKLALDSLRMSREHLADGVGVGAFEVAYPTYQTSVTDLVIDFAHNDYAQFFAEAGIIGSGAGLHRCVFHPVIPAPAPAVPGSGWLVAVGGGYRSLRNLGAQLLRFQPPHPSQRRLVCVCNWTGGTSVSGLLRRKCNPISESITK